MIYIIQKSLIFILTIILSNSLISQIDVVNIDVIDDNIKVIFDRRAILSIKTEDTLNRNCEGYYIDLPDSIKEKCKIQIDILDRRCDFYIGFSCRNYIFHHPIIPIQIKDKDSIIVNTILFKNVHHPSVRSYLGGIKDTIIDDLGAFLEKPVFEIDAGITKPKDRFKTLGFQLTVYNPEGEIIKEYTEVNRDSLSQEQIEFLYQIPKHSRICFYVMRNDGNGCRRIGMFLNYYYRGDSDR